MRQMVGAWLSTAWAVRLPSGASTDPASGWRTELTSSENSSTKIPLGCSASQRAAVVEPVDAGDRPVGAAVSLDRGPRNGRYLGAGVRVPDADPLAVGDGEDLAVRRPRDRGGPAVLA